MIGMNVIHTVKAKQIIIVFAAILLWQVSFPQQLAVMETGSVPSSNDQPLRETAADTIQAQLPKIADKPQPETKRSLYIPVTAYSSTPDQTSGDPFITASGSRVHNGVVAANFLPIGTKVRFPEHFGNKIFVVEDRMHQRYWQKADIWMSTRDKAKTWGVKYTKIEIL